MVSSEYTALELPRFDSQIVVNLRCNLPTIKCEKMAGIF